MMGKDEGRRGRKEGREEKLREGLMDVRRVEDN
jgi:hypothetical protein